MPGGFTRFGIVKRLIVICTFPVFGLCAIDGGQAITPDRIQTRSWVDLERYSGSSDSVRSTSADFKQLAYELQALRATQPARMSAAQQVPYGTIMPPRNNLGNRVPLTLIHWDRTLEAVTPEQQHMAISAGVAPEPILTNMTIFAVAPVRPTTYRGASVALSLAADDLFEETGSSNTIQTLRIDPGDGSGWQAFATGQSINANNKRWFIRSILEEYDTDGDDCDDYQEYLIGTAYDSEFSTLEGAKMIAMNMDTEFVALNWDWLPNVKYEVYFTDNLAREWTLVPPESYFCWSFPSQATAYLPRSSESGFYKIVSEIQDPVTD